MLVPFGWSVEAPAACSMTKLRHEPILVTTDSALHISHPVFDWALRFLETAHLTGDLTNLTDALPAQMMGYADGAPTGELRAAALDCACYLSVGKRLPRW